jgi:hypothetical protein
MQPAADVHAAVVRVAHQPLLQALLCAVVAGVVNSAPCSAPQKQILMPFYDAPVHPANRTDAINLLRFNVLSVKVIWVALALATRISGSSWYINKIM